MLKKLRLRYEAHADTEIELSPGLTVVLGDNDVGKSAVSRGLKWVVTNNPRGDEMIPWEGKQEARSELETDAGTVVRLKKGKISTYEVNGEVYKALGAAVPEEVSNVLSMDETNIQAQVDQYFLLQASPGTVAKRINEVAGISDSDVAIKRSNELIGEATKELKKQTTIIKEKEDYIKLNDAMIDSAEDELDALFSLETDVEADVDAVEIASEFSQQLKDCQVAVNKFPNYFEIHGNLDAIERLEASVEKQAERHRAALGLLGQLRAVDLTVFDVLDETNLLDMEIIAKGIELSEAWYEEATDLRGQLSSIDLSIYDDLAGAQAVVDGLDGYASYIAKSEVALQMAEDLSKQIHALDLKKYDVLAEVEFDEMVKLEFQIMNMEAKERLMIATRFSQLDVENLEKELQGLYAEISDQGLICETCGQIIGGDDETCNILS